MKQNQLYKEICIALKYLLEIRVFRECWCFYMWLHLLLEFVQNFNVIVEKAHCFVDKFLD